MRRCLPAGHPCIHTYLYGVRAAVQQVVHPRCQLVQDDAPRPYVNLRHQSQSIPHLSDLTRQALVVRSVASRQCSLLPIHLPHTFSVYGWLRSSSGAIQKAWPAPMLEVMLPPCVLGWMTWGGGEGQRAAAGHYSHAHACRRRSRSPSPCHPPMHTPTTGHHAAPQKTPRYICMPCCPRCLAITAPPSLTHITSPRAGAHPAAPHLRQAKVADLDIKLLRQQDVVGLHVPVDHLVAVEEAQPVRDLVRDGKAGAGREALALDVGRLSQQLVEVVAVPAGGRGRFGAREVCGWTRAGSQKAGCIM